MFPTKIKPTNNLKLYNLYIHKAVSHTHGLSAIYHGYIRFLTPAVRA